MGKTVMGSDITANFGGNTSDTLTASPDALEKYYWFDFLEDGTSITFTERDLEGDERTVTKTGGAGHRIARSQGVHTVIINAGSVEAYRVLPINENT